MVSPDQIAGHPVASKCSIQMLWRTYLTVMLSPRWRTPNEPKQYLAKPDEATATVSPLSCPMFCDQSIQELLHLRP